MAKEKGVRRFEETIIDYTPEKNAGSKVVLAVGTEVMYNDVRSSVTKVRRIWIEVANMTTGDKRWTKRGNLEIAPAVSEEVLPAEEIEAVTAE